MLVEHDGDQITMMDVDYSPNERLALIVDILAEGALILSAVINFLDAFDHIRIKDFARVEIVPSDVIFSNFGASKAITMRDVKNEETDKR